MILVVSLLLFTGLGATFTHGNQDAGTGLAGWMNKVDQLLLQQDQRLQQLESENQKLRAETQSLRAENRQLKAKDRKLEKDVTHLKDAVFSTERACCQSAYEVFKDQQKDAHVKRVTQPHNMAVRSDDFTPLEPVVTQMSQQLTEVSAEIQALKNTNTQQDTAIQEAGSSVYVRWGRSVCPSSTHLVYSGVVGGSWYNNVSAAPNALCLSLSPALSNHAIPVHHAMLYGSEYATWDSHHNKDVVCAVCRSQRPTTIMVPGTNMCMQGWTLEYSGFLMANDQLHDDHQAGTDYACVDSGMEDRAGGDTDQNGLLLHYTVTQCGSLPCGPYVNNKVVTCAVCSQ